MRAAIYDRTGAARDVLRVVELDDPVAGAGEVRVRLEWSGVNPSDVKARAGRRAPMHDYPFTVPHSDGMGVIDQVGLGVGHARLGQRVWVWNGAFGRQFGTAAEYIALPAAQAVPLSDKVPGMAAACFGIPALTAMHAVLHGAGVQGRRLLVSGGAGAVGHYAVQFAKLLGASLVVATVSSDEKASVARLAGADAVLNYRRDDLVGGVLGLTQGEGVDRVIEVDIAANAPFDVELTATGGDWLVYGSKEPHFQLPFFPLISRNIGVHFYVVYRLSNADRQSAIETLDSLLGGGAVQHNVACELELAEIALAHELVEQGSVVGNVVLRAGPASC